MLLTYDINHMRMLLESFYTLTKIRIAIFSSEFTKIAEYPDEDCAFCSVIRQNPEADKKCRLSDQFAFEQCKSSGSLYSYTCHAGLIETVAPIRHGTIIMGYIMFGQVLQQDDRAAYWDTVKQLCAPYQLNEEALKAAYQKKRPMQMKQVLAAAQLLEACAGYLWLQRYITLQENSLLKTIDTYLSENIGADLSVSALCRQFDISRSRLYRLINEFYGKSIEQLVRELRINQAKTLLTSSDDSVTEVAAKVGYDDYNYFIKVFRKETGLTPVKYRKSYHG